MPDLYISKSVPRVNSDIAWQVLLVVVVYFMIKFKKDNQYPQTDVLDLKIHVQDLPNHTYCVHDDFVSVIQQQHSPGSPVW